MNEVIIIGSGFSALLAYYKLVKYNPIIISTTNKFRTIHKMRRRNNLNINKYFSSKTVSFGSLEYKLSSRTKLHDRNNYGGNSNLWGGFINIENLNTDFYKICESKGIKLTKLNLNKNGYKSNCDSIRQLRSYQEDIIDVSKYFDNIFEGLLYSFTVEKNYLKLLIYDKNNKPEIIKTKKLYLCINLPQLVDLLFRSNLLKNKSNLNTTEFEHYFELSFSKKFKNSDYKKDLVIKYDPIRSLKHFFGYQKSLDFLALKLPIYINQHFLNKKRNLKLELNQDYIYQKSENYKFGESIHYCNLEINNININEFINEVSKNIIGLSSPFVKQKEPGPISNDIISHLYNIMD